MTTKQMDALDDDSRRKRLLATPAERLPHDYGTPPKALDLGIQDTADLAVALARIEAVAGLAKSNATAAQARGDSENRRRWLDILIVLGES